MDIIFTESNENREKEATPVLRVNMPSPKSEPNLESSFVFPVVGGKEKNGQKEGNSFSGLLPPYK